MMWSTEISFFWSPDWEPFSPATYLLPNPSQAPIRRFQADPLGTPEHSIGLYGESSFNY